MNRAMPQPAPDAPTLCWSTGRSKTTANWSQVHDKTWSSFVEWLCPEEPAASKEVKPYVGGTLEHGRRSIRTVEQRFLLTLDADYADIDFPFDVADVLPDTPYVIHTTWRHAPEAQRYRLIIPLSRGVNAREYKEIAWMVMNRLDGKRFDVTTVQAERFMWGPATPDKGTYFWEAPHAGSPYLPVDEWLDGHHGPSDGPAANGRANPPPTASATGSGRLTASQEHKDRAVELLLQACDQVEHVYERDDFAGRNEAVFHWMPMLFRFCAAGCLDEETVIDALWGAAQMVEASEPYEQAEFNASVKSARQYAAETGPQLPETTPTKMAQADFEDVEVEADPEADLWSKTPRLKHIAQAADSDNQSRMALLMSVIVRILAEVPPGVCLPGNEDGYIRSRTPLNLGVTLVGASGQGKSELIAASKKLLNRDQDSITGRPSTGQGLIQSFMRWDAESQKNVLIDDPRRIFISDEIDTLGALSNDTGSTLFSEMRTLMTGGGTGTTNATRDRQRTLPSGSYTAQFLVGVQPARAGVILRGSDAGMPQRFVWVQVTDPKNAVHWTLTPAWPGEIGWNDSFLFVFELGEQIVHYPKWLLEELLEHRYKVSKEDMHGGELSRHGHLPLLRLKVAAGVAFLHESTIVEDLHVEIADMILAASKRVQRECERAVHAATLRQKRAAKESDEQVDEEIRDAKLTKFVKSARAALLKANGEWVTWHQMRPAYRDREKYEESVWEALVEMEEVETEEKDHGQRVRRQARIKDGE